MIKFNASINIKKLRKWVSAPTVEVGIYKNAPLWSWRKPLVSLMSGGSEKANMMVKGRQWGRNGVSGSFDSVVANTPLASKYLPADLKKYAPDIFTRFYRSTQSPKDMKMYVNNCTACVKRSYLAMAREMKNDPHRVLRKGHSLYAIGTGQTFRAIEGKEKKG